MQITTKLVVLTGLFLGATFAHAADGTYARTSAIYVSPEADGADETTGVMVALGATFDIPYGDNANQFEMELGWAKWDYAETAVIGGVTYSAKADLTFVPALLTYRYQIALSESLKLAFGPSIGATFLKLSGSVTDGITTESFSDNDVVFSYGAGAQLSYVISESVSLNLGYRYLVNDDASFEISGTEVEVTDLNAHLFEIGLRFDWPY